MNPLSLQNQIIALWVVVLLLIGYILFLQQKRSYFVPQVGNVITMMDLQEYSYLPEAQRQMYVNTLNIRGSQLRATSNNMMNYQTNLNTIMQSAFQQQATTMQTTILPRGNFKIKSASGKFLGRPNSNTMVLALMTSNDIDMFTYTSTNNIQHVQSGMNVMFMPLPMLTQQSVPVTLTKTTTTGTGQYIIKQGTTEVKLDGNSLITLAP